MKSLNAGCCLAIQSLGRLPGPGLSGLIKMSGASAIVVIMRASRTGTSAVHRARTLAQIGLLSFAAVPASAPSLVGGVVWKAGAIHGRGTSLVVGFPSSGPTTLLMPALFAANGSHLEILRERTVRYRLAATRGAGSAWSRDGSAHHASS